MMKRGEAVDASRMMMSISMIFVLYFALQACYAEEAFVNSPPKSAYVNQGSEYLFNWTYTTGPGVFAEMKQWYQSDPSGNALGPLIMRFLNDMVRVLKPGFVGRTFYIANAAMLVKNMTLTDEGYFTCYISYSNGNTQRDTMYLHVTIAPTIGIPLPASTIVDKDTDASWSCQFDAKPAPSIKWYLNGNEIIGPRYQINTTTLGVFRNATRVFTTLTINSTTLADAGVIKCAAIVPNGNASSETFNTVYFPPELKSQSPSFIEMVSFSSINIHCKYIGSPAPIVTWQKIDGNISAAAKINFTVMSMNASYFAVNSTLSFDALDKFDNGVYKCIAKNIAGSQSTNISINVTYPPEFSQRLRQNHTFDEDPTANGSLVCAAVGNPSVDIAWEINGATPGEGYSVSHVLTKMSHGITTESTFTLISILRNRSSTISCKATNSLGNIQSRSTIIINYHPSTSKPMKTMLNVTVGQPAMLSCEIDSQPRSHIYWEKDGKRLNSSFTTTTVVESNNYMTRLQSNLSIPMTNKSDEATYKCIARNIIGNLTQNSYIHVNYAPEFLTSLTKTSRVVEGTAFYTMECIVRSKPASSVSWSKNGTMLSNLTRIKIENVYRNETTRGVTLKSRLTLNNVKKQDYGDYVCTTTNFVGSASSGQLIVITYKPMITSSSNQITQVNLTRTITLFCDFQSSPLARSLAWRWNNKPITNLRHAASNTTILTSSQHTKQRLQLTITNATRFDYGVFECEASNDVGSVKRNITLVVNYAPLLSYNFAKKQNLTESLTIVRFTCTSESHPAATIQWHKNDVPYTSNVIIATNVSLVGKTIMESSLTFPYGIRRTDFGVYKCLTMNYFGNASFSTDVSVFYGPDFRSNMTGIFNITESKNTSFQCVVEGYLKPAILWRKDGQAITSGEYLIQTAIITAVENKIVLRSQINFSNVSDGDTGRYTCEATNVIETKQQNQLLNVQYVPKLLGKSSNITVNQSDSINLHCETKSNPPVARHTWRKDVRLSETGPIYRIQSAQESSTGIYTCVAENDIGSAPMLFFNLKVNLPPTFTKQADCKVKTNLGKIICECSGTGVPAPVVYWTKGTSKAIIGNGSVFEKSLASPDVDGKYNCHLKNLLREISSSYGLYYNRNLYADWSQWSNCNVTCAEGYQIRTRDCNIPPCDRFELTAYKNCTGPCAPKALKKDELWAMVLYILIPIIFVLIVILLLWFIRTNRRKDEDIPAVVPVYENLSKPPSTRSVPTARNIYLPEASFGTVNSAFIEEAETPKKEDLFINMNAVEKSYEQIEAQVKLDEEFPIDSSTDDDVKIQSPISNASENYIDILPPDDPTNAGVDEIQENRSDDTSYPHVDDNRNEERSLSVNDETPASFSFYNELVTAL